jgi:hypothetical protein
VNGDEMLAKEYLEEAQQRIHPRRIEKFHSTASGYHLLLFGSCADLAQSIKTTSKDQKWRLAVCESDRLLLFDKGQYTGVARGEVAFFDPLANAASYFGVSRAELERIFFVRYVSMSDFDGLELSIGKELVGAQDLEILGVGEVAKVPLIPGQQSPPILVDRTSAFANVASKRDAI